jgi:hypothetical protein
MRDSYDGGRKVAARTIATSVQSERSPDTFTFDIDGRYVTFEVDSNEMKYWKSLEDKNLIIAITNRIDAAVKERDAR